MVDTEVAIPPFGHKLALKLKSPNVVLILRAWSEESDTAKTVKAESLPLSFTMALQKPVTSQKLCPYFI